MQDGRQLRVYGREAVDADHRPQAGAVERVVTVAERERGSCCHPVPDAHLGGGQQNAQRRISTSRQAAAMVFVKSRKKKEKQGISVSRAASLSYYFIVYQLSNTSRLKHGVVQAAANECAYIPCVLVKCRKRKFAAKLDDPSRLSSSPSGRAPRGSFLRLSARAEEARAAWEQ